MQEELTIGEVARRAGVRTSAVRYYESVGLLPEPQRRNGRRRYGADVIQMLQIVHLAQAAGFSIAEIRALFYGFAPAPARGEHWRPLVERKLQEVDSAIARALQMQGILRGLLRCGSAQLEDCLLPRASGAAPDPDAHPICAGC